MDVQVFAIDGLSDAGVYCLPVRLPGKLVQQSQSPGRARPGGGGGIENSGFWLGRMGIAAAEPEH